MIMKGAVEIIQQPGPSFYSRLFLVEKVIRGWRPVIDLSSLNNFVTIMKFRMETVVSVCRGDWIFPLDLQNAYFQIPDHRSRLYLRFCFESHVYQFKVLCFGLSTAPKVFTRVFALVSEWAYCLGTCLLRYLDNWLVVVESRDLLRHHALLLQLCSDLGNVVN